MQLRKSRFRDFGKSQNP